MICAVLDTNVYISAFVFGGLPRGVLELAEAGVFQIAISKPIQEEVQEVLVKKFGWSQGQALSACEPIWDLARVVAPQTTVTLAGDPADNRILECALEARADVVVTGDSHLLRLLECRAIPIITPRDFLRSGMWIQR